jgi:hypothetical protein
MGSYALTHPKEASLRIQRKRGGHLMTHPKAEEGPLRRKRRGGLKENMGIL